MTVGGLCRAVEGCQHSLYHKHDEITSYYLCLSSPLPWPKQVMAFFPFGWIRSSQVFLQRRPNRRRAPPGPCCIDSARKTDAKQCDGPRANLLACARPASMGCSKPYTWTRHLLLGLSLPLENPEELSFGAMRDGGMRPESVSEYKSHANACPKQNRDSTPQTHKPNEESHGACK